MKSLFILLAIAILGCKPEKRNSGNNISVINSNEISGCDNYIFKHKHQNLNISILLDLSDRIDLENQQLKDMAYILALAKSFNNHVKGKKIGLLYDKMEVFFEPAPSDPKIYQISQQLKISYTKEVSKNEWIPKTEEVYSRLPAQLYDLARKGSKTHGYPGSDTWRFFKDQVKDYCIDQCRRNILVIITDGYLYHEKSVMKDGNKTSYITPQSMEGLKLNQPDWKKNFLDQNLGFIPATDGLEDLEVLVLGVTNLSENNPYGQDILEFYWSSWFDEMGVKKYKIKNADIPTNMSIVIDEFIRG